MCIFINYYETYEFLKQRFPENNIPSSGKQKSSHHRYLFKYQEMNFILTRKTRKLPQAYALYILFVGLAAHVTNFVGAQINQLRVGNKSQGTPCQFWGSEKITLHYAYARCDKCVQGSVANTTGGNK